MSQASTILPGVGTRLVSTPLGDILAASGGGTGSYRHPFKASLAGGGLRFAKGIVLATLPHEPTIGGVPISGDATRPAPVLKLDRSVLAAGATESWACVEFAPNAADGSTGKDTLVEVVHRASPFPAADLPGGSAASGPAKDVARHPLCMILWRGDAPAKILQIAYFNLRYYRSSPLPGQGAPRHFFL